MAEAAELKLCPVAGCGEAFTIWFYLRAHLVIEHDRMYPPTEPGRTFQPSDPWTRPMPKDKAWARLVLERKTQSGVVHDNVHGREEFLSGKEILDRYDPVEGIDKICTVANCQDRFVSTAYYHAHLIAEHQRVYVIVLTGETFGADAPWIASSAKDQDWARKVFNYQIVKGRPPGFYGDLIADLMIDSSGRARDACFGVSSENLNRNDSSRKVKDPEDW